MIRAVGIVAVSLALLGAGTAQALTLEPVGSFDQPIYVTSDPADANRLFVAEREGTIRLVEDRVASGFADIGSKVECGGSCQGERGLMSIALAPDFDSSGRLFVFYANDITGTLHIEELVSEDPGHDEAAISTLRPLLSIPHPTQANHNGGQLQFGPEGELFVSTGDGGGSNDPLDNAQDLSSPLGKLLHIDPDSEAEAPYTTWASGLRNPFRFSFDSITSDMVIGDVGQIQREEIDFAPSPFPGVVGGQGANYGWDCREGLLAGAGPSPACTLAPADAFTEPVFDYPHSPDPNLGGLDRCAVIGGYVARDPALGALYGRYVYTDLCSGALRALQLPLNGSGPASGDCSLGLRVENPVSFGEDAVGQIYVVEQGGGVFRLEGLPPVDCPSLPLQPPQKQPEAKPQPEPTFVGITPQRRRVERGKTAVLTVWVSPCRQRRGETVALLRNGHRNGSKFLSRACTARFLRRVHRNAAFAAITYSSDDYLAGSSRILRIRIEPRRQAARQP